MFEYRHLDSWYYWKQIFKKVVSGKTSFFLIGPIYTPHSIFDRAVLYGNVSLSSAFNLAIFNLLDESPCLNVNTLVVYTKIRRPKIKILVLNCLSNFSLRVSLTDHSLFATYCTFTSCWKYHCRSCEIFFRDWEKRTLKQDKNKKNTASLVYFIMSKFLGCKKIHIMHKDRDFL